MTEEEIPHAVVDPWGRGDVVGRKIDPPYGLVITAISDLRGWLRNSAEQTNTDETGAEVKELVIPEIKILALIDKLQEVGETYLDEQKVDNDNYNESMDRMIQKLSEVEKQLVKARQRVLELKAVDRGLRLAIRGLVKR
jgi:hypothetical protein